MWKGRCYFKFQDLTHFRHHECTTLLPQAQYQEVRGVMSSQKNWKKPQSLFFSQGLNVHKLCIFLFILWCSLQAQILWLVIIITLFLYSSSIPLTLSQLLIVLPRQTLWLNPTAPLPGAMPMQLIVSGMKLFDHTGWSHFKFMTTYFKCVLKGTQQPYRIMLVTHSYFLTSCFLWVTLLLTSLRKLKQSEDNFPPTSTLPVDSTKILILLL